MKDIVLFAENSYSEVLNMFFKRFAKIIIFGALIMFFTPFVMVSCSNDAEIYDVSVKDESSVKFSGIDLIVGNFENNDADDELFEQLDIDTNEFKTNIWFIGACICCVIALVILFTQKTNYISAALSAASAFLLIIFKTSFVSYYELENYIGFFDIEIQLGFKLCLAFMIASSVCCFLSQREEDKEEMLKSRMENNIESFAPKDIFQEQVHERQPAPSKARSSLEPKTQIKRTSRYNGTLSVEELLKRATIFIEDKDWEKACEYCQNALDVDAGCADAYLALFMAEYNISSEDRIPFACRELAVKLGSLFAIENYKKASRFGDESFKAKLESYNQQAIYNYAVEFFDNCTDIESCSQAKTFFQMIPDYLNFKDAKELLEKCNDKGNALTYDKAVSSMKLSRFKEAIEYFEKIPDYMDSNVKIEECKLLIDNKIYKNALQLMNEAVEIGEIIKAKEKFLSIAGYNNAKEMAEQCDELIRVRTIYDKACYVMDGVSYKIDIWRCLIKYSSEIKGAIDNLYIAKDMFLSIPDYSDSKNKISECDKKIEMRKNEYDRFIKMLKTAVIVFVSFILLLCIIIPIVRNINDRKTNHDTVTSSYEVETSESQYVPALSDTPLQSETVFGTTSAEHNESSEAYGSIGELVLYDNTYNSDTIDYIGTYDGWTYFSDVTDVVIKTQLYLYGTVYFCDVAINRVNIETGECENLVKTCCSSATYDDITRYFSYDFAVSSGGKIVFTYDDPNTFEIISSAEYGGKESYTCDSYIFTYDITTAEINQISVSEAENPRSSENISNDGIEKYLPSDSTYVGENDQGVIYEMDMFICLTNDYKNADFYNDCIFDLKFVREHEKEIYESYGFQDKFDDIGVGFYYDLTVSGKWIVINTSVNSIDISYENQYYLNSETGICSNVQLSGGTGQYKDASNYILNRNMKDSFDFSIGYVTIDSGVLNVRNEPSFDSNIVGTLEDNTRVGIYDYKNGWYLIYYYDYDTNLYGYVSSDYITIY